MTGGVILQQQYNSTPDQPVHVRLKDFSKMRHPLFPIKFCISQPSRALPRFVRVVHVVNQVVELLLVHVLRAFFKACDTLAERAERRSRLPAPRPVSKSRWTSTVGHHGWVGGSDCQEAEKGFFPHSRRLARVVILRSSPRAPRNVLTANGGRNSRRRRTRPGRGRPGTTRAGSSGRAAIGRVAPLPSRSVPSGP